MTALKITSVGNSAGVLLPKELLTKLRVDKGDVLHVIETENGIELTPYDPEFDAQMAVAEDIMREDRDILRKLAKGQIQSGSIYASLRPFTIGKLMSMAAYRGFVMRDCFYLPYLGPRMPFITLTQNQMWLNSQLHMGLASQKIIHSMTRISAQHSSQCVCF